MKKIGIKIVSAVFFMAIITNFTFAQSNFKNDLKAFHKKAVMTCGLIKKPDMHKKAEMLEGLKEFRGQLNDLKKNYLNNPPEDYSNDPLWKSYFMEFEDIINALQTRIGKENYKAAAMNCSRFCMLFGKMHAINGKLELSDKMFMWMAQVTMTTNMVNAANYKDAKGNLKKVRMVYKNVIDAKKIARNEGFNKQFEPIDTLYTNWLDQLENNKYQEASDTFKKFSAAFGKVFLLSIM